MLNKGTKTQESTHYMILLIQSTWNKANSAIVIEIRVALRWRWQGGVVGITWKEE